MENRAVIRPLYRRLLGAEFDRLGRHLRDFHDELGERRGQLQVKWGAGRLRHAVAWLLRMPPPRARSPVRLLASQRGAAEIWIRHFGSASLITRQWERRGFLMEAAGPLTFQFEVSVDGGGMRFTQQRAWFLCVPLPRALAPVVAARVDPTQRGWEVEVTISVPRLGVVASYGGEMMR